jgi:hypothetical protein
VYRVFLTVVPRPQPIPTSQDKSPPAVTAHPNPFPPLGITPVNRTITFSNVLKIHDLSLAIQLHILLALLFHFRCNIFGRGAVKTCAPP